jgi:toxin YoeB
MNKQKYSCLPQPLEEVKAVPFLLGKSQNSKQTVLSTYSSSLNSKLSVLSTYSFCLQEMTKYSNGCEKQQPERKTVYTRQFKKDLKYWKKHCLPKYQHIKELIQATTDNPFAGIGNPKPLAYTYYEGHKASSREINDEHRFVYVVTADVIYFLQARYHYVK